ncbi:TrmJ/YjtD family RNA methyltransferase [Candidatus Woesearchaeota archaeon]|nr:TrmJ/YjtD family RNA methyltransferase [Candidatus Woesearchaeota archaeon]
MLDIILLEPKEPGNIGAIARVMKNFGFSSLVLVNPQCDYRSVTARNRAKHAQDVLAGAKIVPAVGRYHTLIGTTGRLGTDYNLSRSPLAPKQVALLSLPRKAGLLFGREGIGLTNKEIMRCDFLVSIPASPEYPVLNVSHAVAIVLYELCNVKKSTDHILPAHREEKMRALRVMTELIDQMIFPTSSMMQTQKIVWKRVLGKSMLTHREAAAIMGFCRRAMHLLSRQRHL